MRSLTRRVRWWAQKLFGRVGSQLTGARALPGVPGVVHERDTMYDPNHPEGVDFYLRAGRSAVEAIAAALETVERSPESIDSALDYGCGYGRVLRHLPDLLPRAGLVACDLDARAVRFCEQAFGARGVVASADPRRLDLPACDLIWGGSVFTHLPADDCGALFGALCEALRPGGVLVFSFHGPFAFENLEYLFGGAYRDEAESILSDVEAGGIAYRSYPETYLHLDSGRYGTAWHTAEYFRGLAQASAVSLSSGDVRPQGWDQFHDVIAFERLT